MTYYQFIYIYLTQTSNYICDIPKGIAFSSLIPCITILILFWLLSFSISWLVSMVKHIMLKLI